MDLDATGKTSFDDIYTRPDPRGYFSVLSELDYRIPDLAKPYFLKLIHEYRETRRAEPTVLDIGCSYGINAALLRCDSTMEELAERYGAAGAADTATLAEADRRFVGTRAGLDGVRFVGFDASESALAYAHAAGFVDDTLHADLESADPTDAQRAKLAGVDIVVSTGCVGYVTEKTIGRVAAVNRPWMAHFVLRMFSFAPIAERLGTLGYQTERVDGVFPQRRFASPREQSQMLDSLAAAGVDPTGLESEGWLYAQLFVSRPRDTL
ncbi:class I SAM-dependent methyltransferase [Actinokineospora sp. HUAS TT18]|uniref:class I SAM-dependent methyltransferase n=1 Tax=Actinokineospora sp. HUAS TT18 TaxID=3447451 RepID=UPI003F51D32E